MTQPSPKPTVWLGDTLATLRACPWDVQDEMGYALYLAQIGEKYAGAKPLKGLGPGVRRIGVPFTQIAAELGKVMVKNIVALGALQEATGLFPKETFLTAIRQALREKYALVPLNEEAFARGARAVRDATGASS